MDEIYALHAIGQPTRFRVVRLLLPKGALPAGGIAAALNIRQNTLSSHMAILRRAGLIEGDRQGRRIFYAANRQRIEGLAAFLLKEAASSGPLLRG